MTDDFKATFDGVDITEYVNREDVQRAIASVELPDGTPFEMTGQMRQPTEDELAEIAQIYAESTMIRTVTVNAGEYKFTYIIDDDGRTIMSDEDMREMIRYFEDKGVFAEVDRDAGTLTLMPGIWWDLHNDSQP